MPIKSTSEFAHTCIHCIHGNLFLIKIFVRVVESVLNELNELDEWHLPPSHNEDEMLWAIEPDREKCEFFNITLWNPHPFCTGRLTSLIPVIGAQVDGFDQDRYEPGDAVEVQQTEGGDWSEAQVEESIVAEDGLIW